MPTGCDSMTIGCQSTLWKRRRPLASNTAGKRSRPSTSTTLIGCPWQASCQMMPRERWKENAAPSMSSRAVG